MTRSAKPLEPQESLQKRGRASCAPAGTELVMDVPTSMGGHRANGPAPAPGGSS